MSTKPELRNSSVVASTSVSAVIINWNSLEKVKSCVESLKRTTLPFLKIIIVDNGSIDGSVEVLSEIFGEDENISLLRNPRNLGFAGGMNVGLRYAIELGSEFAFVFNNDASIDPDCVRLLVAEAQKEGAGIAGPRVFYENNRNKIWQGGGHFSKLRAGVRNPEKNAISLTGTDRTENVDFVTGCAMLVRTQIIKSIGFYDESYFIYAEDVDFCLHARREGIKVIYVPAAHAYHDLEGINRSRTSPYVMFHLARSTVIFLGKDFGVLYFIYAILLHLVLYTPYRLLQSILGGNSFKGWVGWIKGTLSGLRFLMVPEK